MKTFEGRVAAVTGAASGIGEALALRLTRAGCHLALCDTNSALLAGVADRVRTLNVNCSVHVVDVSSRSEVEQFAEDVIGEHGYVHMVFNNAGIALADYVETHSYDDFEQVMDVNFWGVVYGTKAFLPYLKQVDEAHIINISSLFGLGALPSQAAYNASKFAVKGFTEALKMELSASNIGVSSVHPGGIKTNIVKNSKIAESNVKMSKARFEQRFDQLARTTADKAAATILNGVRKNKRRILVGNDARIADFIIRMFPGSYEHILRLEKPVHKRWGDDKN